MKHMLRKRNDLEILNILQNNPKHIRQIAKDLDMIPSTVMRTVRTLMEENVVDYKKIGKNKEFYLKDSIEKNIYLNLAENYKKLKIIQKPKIRRIVEELIKTTNNELIVLFGSYSKGIENKNSDIDIYIEIKSNSLKKELEKISNKLSIKIGDFDKESLLGKEIIKNHIIIQNIERYFNIIK